mmetsp:Transcript_16722/g.26823  ORF Transcript_16722/g.26823 Transcript_16722/m.26823 type:complete len:246 (+) Transcript_16722:340-1077(+)
MDGSNSNRSPGLFLADSRKRGRVRRWHPAAFARESRGRGSGKGACRPHKYHQYHRLRAPLRPRRHCPRHFSHQRAHGGNGRLVGRHTTPHPPGRGLQLARRLFCSRGPESGHDINNTDARRLHQTCPAIHKREERAAATRGGAPAHRGCAVVRTSLPPATAGGECGEGGTADARGVPRGATTLAHHSGHFVADQRQRQLKLISFYIIPFACNKINSEGQKSSLTSTGATRRSCRAPFGRMSKRPF